MEDRAGLLQRMGVTRAVVVVRANEVNGLCDLAGALAEVGLDILEVTMTTPGALQRLEELRAAHPNVLVGAGTVLDPEDAHAAILAGAQFLVSPVLHVGMIEVAHRYGALAIPGTFTPTEALAAWEAGADLVKLFPASVGGSDYVKALRGPLPQLRFVPTGGVTVDTVEGFLRAGAFAVCLGSSLVDGQSLACGEYDGVLKRAERLVSVIRSVPLP